MCVHVPCFNYIVFIVPEKSLMIFFHLWQIVKSIKGFYPKSYGPLALILVYKIHQPTDGRTDKQCENSISLQPPPPPHTQTQFAGGIKKDKPYLTS